MFRNTRVFQQMIVRGGGESTERSKSLTRILCFARHTYMYANKYISEKFFLKHFLLVYSGINKKKKNYRFEKINAFE